MDNRDAGLSQGFDALGLPNMARAGLRYALHLAVDAPYRLIDMAADAAGVLDALGLASAHVCGVSMGGMIAQHLAAAQPRRVRSLTLMMTTSGSRRLPQPSWRVQAALLRRPTGNDRTAVVRHLLRMFSLVESPGYPADPAARRALAGALADRAWRPAGTVRHIAAVVADGDRSPQLARIQAPTCVIHGEVDVLVPVAAGHDLAARIRGARLDVVPGMSHDLPAALLPRFADDIAQVAQRSSSP
jgi:pimeloyl-ACP methyl ester carboxylesterase